MVNCFVIKFSQNMLNAETDPLKKVTKMMLASNEVILAKDQISLADVRQYLISNLETGKILEESNTIFSTTVVEGNEQLSQAIENWDHDRNYALYLLLFFVDSSRGVNDKKTGKASAKCLTVLIEEPLVPSRDPARYSKIISEVGSEVDLAKPTNSIDLPLHQTHLSGVLFNAATFCPEVFVEMFTEKPITDEEIRKMRNTFLNNLNLLRGIQPGEH